MHRPLRMPGLPVFACLAFVFSTELLYWAKWPLTGEIILLIVVALPVYFYFQAKAGWHDFGRQLARRLVADRLSADASRWSHMSAARGSAGMGYLPYGWDLVVVAIIGLGFYFWGLRCGWRTPDVDAVDVPGTADAHASC